MGADTGAGPSGTTQVTVWEADGSPWTGAGYGSEIARRLAAAGYAVRTVPLQQRRPDDDELAAPLHVLSGGTTPATTATGWIAATRRPLEEVLDRAHVGAATVVGVCLGAQLLAVSLAGPRAVRPARRGMEVGLHRVRCAESGTEHVVSQFHHHEVRPSALRAIGATVTFANDHTRVQGFALGATVVGYQFHPELDPPRTASVIRANRDVIRSVGSCPTTALGTVRRHGAEWSPLSFDQLVTRRLAAHGLPSSRGRRQLAS